MLITILVNFDFPGIDLLMIRTEQWVLIMNELDTDTDTLKYLLALIGPDSNSSCKVELASACL